jgi:hypothetical protein
MSHSSRFAAVYEGLPLIGVLVDELALALRAGEDVSSDAASVGRLLSSLESNEPQSLAHIQLSAILTARGVPLGRWTELGRRLETDAVDAHDMAELDELGKAIALASADQREPPAR